MTRLPPCLLLGLLWLPAAALGQQGESPEFVRVRVGLADRYKVGLWTPVELTVRGGSRQWTGSVSVTVPDGDGVPSRVTTASDKPCRVPPGRETTVRLYVRFGRVESRLTAEFRAAGRLLARKTFETGHAADRDHFLPAIDSGQQLLVAIGPDAMGLEEAASEQQPAAETKPVVVRLEDVGQLSAQWYGYEGVDALVLSTSRPETYRKLTSGSAEIEALDQWVRMGGKLILCGGSQAEQVLHPQSPLARFAPGRFQRMEPLRQTGALETYCGSSIPVPLEAESGRPLEFRVPQLSEVEGTIEAREADLPLVVRRAWGFGQIVWLAADLDRPPVSTWKARWLLVRRLLDLPVVGREEVAENKPIMHYGFVDTAGQLRKALNRFTDVRLVPFWFIALLVGGYILLIGPVDYFFLRKFVGRMEFTWITFPTIVLAVSLAAYFLAYRLKGDQVRVNQVDLLDVDAASGCVRGTVWADIFSPQTDCYDFSVRARLPDGAVSAEARVLLSWLGLPGGALGGMAPSTVDPVLGNRPYEFSPELDGMLGVPIQVWSTKSLTARWTARTNACLKADLVDEDQILSGTISSPLNFDLSRCVLAYSRWAYDLGTLERGGSFRLGPSVRRSELQTFLTGRKIVFADGREKYRQQSTPYDQSSIDVPYILQAMMFYEAAGGERYIGLLNRYQHFVDLSELLKTNRAILVAMGPRTAAGPGRVGAEILNDGQPLAGPGDTCVTLYRFIFPVKH